jgi:hypothetical protein
MEYSEFSIYSYKGKRLVFDADYRTQGDTPLENVIAAAIIAKELNDNEYVKKGGKSEYVRKIDHRGDEYDSFEVVKLSNYTLVTMLLVHYPALVKERVTEATELLSSLQLDFMFKALTNDAEGYEGNVLKIIAKPEVMSTDFGIVAYLPFYSENQEKERAYKERISNSKHLGKEGEKLKLAIENISVRRVTGDNYSGWSINAIANDGDLVSFFTTKEELTKQVGYYGVTAKVKSLGKDWKYKEFNETKLTYVSLIR